MLGPAARRLAALGVALTASLPGSAPLAGQTLPPASDQNPSPEARTPFFKGGPWLRIGFGSFTADQDGQLPGQRGHRAATLSVGGELSRAPYLSLELELLSLNRSFETDGGSLIFVWIDDETSVETWASSLGARLILPPSSPVRAYVSGGLAYVQTRLKTNAYFLGIPGTAAEQRHHAVRPVLGAGAQMLLGDWAVHADYRWIGVTGSFPDYEIRDVPLGGRVVSFGLAWRGLARAMGDSE